LYNASTPNKVDYFQDFTIATATSTPLLDISNASPKGTGVNYLLTDKIEIPIVSTNHLYELVVDDSKITVTDGVSSKKNLSKPSEIIDNKLVVYVENPLSPNVTITVSLGSGTLADGSSLNTFTSYTFTTSVSSDEVLVRKVFSLSHGNRKVKETEIDSIFDLNDYMSLENVYNSEYNYDVSSRKVYLFKKRVLGESLDLSIVKLSNEYDPTIDSNDWGSFHDIHVDEGEISFGHDMIENTFEFELVVFAVYKTASEALSWATTNLT
jgi:hypothetical protein